MPKIKLNDIRGWLLFYTIFLFFRLVLGIFTLTVFLQINIITVAEFLFITVALGAILTKFHTKEINILYLLLSLVFTFLVYFEDITSNVLQSRAKGVGSVIGAAVVSTAWVLYWVNSKRVKKIFSKRG